MGLVVPFALAPLDVYPVIFFVCIILCNLLYVCPIKLIKKKKNSQVLFKVEVKSVCKQTVCLHFELLYFFKI
jgi:hypothetical protein